MTEQKAAEINCHSIRLWQTDDRQTDRWLFTTM